MAAHLGVPIAVPSGLDEAGLETWRQHLEVTLRSHTQITDEHAEGFYASGSPLHTLSPLRHLPASDDPTLRTAEAPALFDPANARLPLRRVSEKPGAPHR